jgi:hypothetical protein
MDQLLCEKLDDYLLGLLSADEATAFKRHLADCPVCRRECAVQKTIDDLLAEDGELPGEIPAGLVDRARCYVQTTRRRKAVRLGLGIAATAAALFFAVSATFVFRSGRQKIPEIAVIKDTAETRVNGSLPTPFPGSEPLAISSRVKMSDPASGIVLECKTRDPKITIVCIYPTISQVAQSDE